MDQLRTGHEVGGRTGHGGVPGFNGVAVSSSRGCGMDQSPAPASKSTSTAPSPTWSPPRTR